MKRSEMVGKLSDALLQFMPRVSKTRRDLMADVVLTEVERERMLPPCKFNFNEEYDEGDVKSICINHCQWEQE